MTSLDTIVEQCNILLKLTVLALNDTKKFVIGLRDQRDGRTHLPVKRYTICLVM